MPTVAPEILTRFVEDILAAAGSGAEEAGIVADHLVAANLAGHDSHGVGMLPRYMENLVAGRLLPNRHATLVRDAGPVMAVDGGSGYGQVILREATDLAIGRARAIGVVALTVRGAHHVGRIGAYGERCAAAGVVGLFFVNVVGHDPLVAAHGGRDARLGTNPICIAIPGPDGQPAMLLDMATSMVALGKARVAMNKGLAMGEGLILDAEGQPTIDPNAMFRTPMGALLPAALHKGYGLALAAELLGGVLSGGGTMQPGNKRDRSIFNHTLIVAIDPDHFVDRAWFDAETAALLAHAKAAPPRDPAAPVLVPGEPEAASRIARGAGIPIDPATWGELATVAAGFGVTPPPVTS